MATIMVQGTTSDAGKSFLVTALGRWLARQGFAVAPFKPQNMALNSAVTEDGGEIGRAQAVQAEACRVAPHTDMNPVLIKPSSDTGAQIIIHGKALSNMEAAAFHDYKRTAMEAVLASHQRLSARYEHIVVEGAGSPAEINLRAGDIANMGFAEAVDCPVIIISDIDRGGVFAHLVGTLELLSPTEQERVAGFVINRFRGDISLLQPGLDWLEERTGKPVLGVIPYAQDLYLEAEDALPRIPATVQDNQKFQIIIPALPRISNHTDFDPLLAHPDIACRFIGPAETPPAADLIILPGSKHVANDIAWLRERGWDQAIMRHLRFGGKLIGICGGLQMLGQEITDPLGVESKAGTTTPGFGLCQFSTELKQQKELHQRQGKLAHDGAAARGYEIHAGHTTGPDWDSPLVRSNDNRGPATDGYISENICATYWHGIFDEPAACASLLSWAGCSTNQQIDCDARREETYERMADLMNEHCDTEALLRLLNG